MPNRRAKILLVCFSILSLPTKATAEFNLVFSFSSVSAGGELQIEDWLMVNCTSNTTPNVWTPVMYENGAVTWQCWLLPFKEGCDLLRLLSAQRLELLEVHSWFFTEDRGHSHLFFKTVESRQIYTETNTVMRRSNIRINLRGCEGDKLNRFSSDSRRCFWSRDRWGMMQAAQHTCRCPMCMACLLW